VNPSISIKSTARSRHIRITVREDGSVLVTKPKWVSIKSAEAFVMERSEWIETTIANFGTKRKGPAPTQLPRPRKNSRAYKEARETARKLVTERLAYFNQFYGFTYGTISIRDQKTRWGSCSANGNLSFNYRLIYLPPELADYVVVHELCHTKEHNHSERFWKLVEQTVPAHKLFRKKLHTGFR